MWNISHISFLCLLLPNLYNHLLAYSKLWKWHYICLEKSWCSLWLQSLSNSIHSQSLFVHISLFLSAWIQGHFLISDKASITILGLCFRVFHLQLLYFYQRLIWLLLYWFQPNSIPQEYPHQEVILLSHPSWFWVLFIPHY